MDFIWILVAFVCGFSAKQIGLPPLVGFLVAGFGLNAAGIEAFSGLDTLTNIGITLLLFTIGLKINLRDLVKPEVAGGAMSHIVLWCLGLGILLIAFTYLNQTAEFNTLTAFTIAFALSFSSTVCVMKTLEINAELKTTHGNLSIGVLVIQDIAAVLFLVFAAGKFPSYWAIGLLLLPFAQHFICKIIDRSGHDELLVLVGFFLALGAYELFDSVGIKGDLGALYAGMIIAGTKKANELYKVLISFKDLFLIGFFLSIGLSALPNIEMVGWALLIVALLPLKFLLFFVIFIRFGTTARTAMLTGLALMNFSEFGLIVASYSVEKEWIDNSTLVIFALAVAMSFVLNTLVYSKAHSLFARFKTRLHSYESSSASNSAVYHLPEDAEVLIVGMGRVGNGAYWSLEKEMGGKVCGIDADAERLEKHKQNGVQVAYGDADDVEFWELVSQSNIRLIMLAIPSIIEMKNVLEQLKSTNYQGQIATVARYDDEREELLELGADVVFNYYAEVGAGFADECAHLLEPNSSTG